MLVLTYPLLEVEEEVIASSGNEQNRAKSRRCGWGAISKPEQARTSQQDDGEVKGGKNERGRAGTSGNGIE